MGMLGVFHVHARNAAPDATQGVERLAVQVLDQRNIPQPVIDDLPRAIDLPVRELHQAKGPEGQGTDRVCLGARHGGDRQMRRAKIRDKAIGRKDCRADAFRRKPCFFSPVRMRTGLPRASRALATNSLLFQASQPSSSRRPVVSMLRAIMQRDFSLNNDVGARKSRS